MFRENVLIALTILVTILTLSYVILITVYLELGEMDRQLATLEVLMRQEEAKAKAKIKIVTVDKDGDNDGKHDELLGRVKEFWDFKGTDKEQSTDSVVEDNEPEEDYQFRDDTDQNDNWYPIPSYKGSDYLFRKPRYYGDEARRNAEIISRMINKIQTYEMQKQMQEFENRMLLMNEVGRVSRTLSRPRYREPRDRVSGEDSSV